MRKQLAIGLSMLTLTGMGGVSENSFVSVEGQGVSQQYTHLVETSLNQTFEPMSGASLEIGLPNHKSFQTASVQFITGGQNLDFGNIDFGDPTIDRRSKFRLREYRFRRPDD